MSLRTVLPLLFLFAAGPALGAGASPGEKSHLLGAIASGSRPELNRAIERIKYLGSPRDLLQAIERLLDAGSPGTRRNAAFALRFLGTKRQALALVRALGDDDEVIREYACVALGQLRAQEAVQPLSKLTKDRSPVVRREAVAALGAIGNKAGVKPALALLEDEVPETRLAAILALGKLKDGRAAAKLTPLLKDGSETTRLAAAKSLCMLGNAEGRAVADKLLRSTEPTERRDGIRLIEEVKAGWASKALLARLEDEDRGTAIAAAVALSKQGDGRGVEWLVLKAEAADVEDKLRLETAIEDLGLTPEDRKKILAAAKTK
ncbi:MAG: HEAT repeat domain-containing protein [Myxococcales bacterium]|jgi:HEAT repeat protein